MKIGSHSQTLVSLTSLLDSAKQNKQTEEQQKQVQNTRDGRLVSRESERELAIQQNRDALKKIQNEIRVKSLAKAKENDEPEDSTKTNINLRENFGNTEEKSIFKKLGQIIDITV